MELLEDALRSPEDSTGTSSASSGSRTRKQPEELDSQGEYLSGDPDWVPSRCWIRSYMRMHALLLSRAREIQAHERSARETSTAAAGQEEPTVADSLSLLRRQVFSLCPIKYLVTGIIFSVTLTVFSFMVPNVQGHLVDSAVAAAHKYATEGPDSVNLYKVLAPGIMQVALLQLGSYFCDILVGILFAMCGQTTVTRLRIKLFKNLVEQEIAFYDKHVSGELSSRLINDSGQLSWLTQFTTQTLLGAIVKFSGSLVSMYLTNPKLAIVATIITPVSTFFVRQTGKVVGNYGVVQNGAMAKANAVAIEVLGSIRTVQANVGEEQEASRFKRSLHYYLRVIKATVYLETVLRFTYTGLSKLRDVVILALAMQQVITGQLTIGQYTAFAQYVSLYEDGFKNLADVWINFRQTITSTGKFVQLLLRVPAISLAGGTEPSTCEGRLKLDSVSFTYAARPDKEVLSKLSLEAQPGQVIALVGESGAGKTTVGRLLLRFYDPTSGSIYLDGIDFRQINLQWLRSQIGFVEQEPILFDRPITDNIAYGSALGSTLEAVQEAARKANAHAFIQQLAQGYETHPGERAARISGGQKQRVAIARAIIRDPKVLLLDEATSALDSENEHIVQEALDKLMSGKTTFIIAHRLSTVVRATRILVLDKGVVVEQGSHQELVSDENTRYSSFMRHQLVSPLLS